MLVVGFLLSPVYRLCLWGWVSSVDGHTLLQRWGLSLYSRKANHIFRPRRGQRISYLHQLVGTQLPRAEGRADPASRTLQVTPCPAGLWVSSLDYNGSCWVLAAVIHLFSLVCLGFRPPVFQKVLSWPLFLAPEHRCDWCHVKCWWQLWLLIWKEAEHAGFHRVSFAWPHATFHLGNWALNSWFSQTLSRCYVSGFG